MQRLRAGLGALLIAAALCGTACSLYGVKSKEMAALDNAYDKGLLTKEEYAVKKTALEKNATAIAALDKAFADGVLTRDEYTAKKAALMSPAPSGTYVQLSVQPAPLTTAITPLPSDAPPATQPLLTPQPAVIPQPPPIAAPASSTANAHTLRMKVLNVVDQQGFERPMVSASMLIPTDWQSQASTAWNIKDRCNTIQTTIHASGPDGRGFDVFPAYAWTWADDPRPLQQLYQQSAQYGTHACDVMQPMGAADFLKRNINRIRPNAQIVAIEPYPKRMEVLQQQAHQTEQTAAQYKLQQRVRPDVVRVRVKYSANGRAVEEWLVVVTVVTATLGPSYNVQAARMTQAYTYNCKAMVTALRAPEGQLDASEKFFDLLAGTYHVNPAWQSRVTGAAQAIQQTELKGIRDRSAIISKNADDIRNIQREGFENQQRTQDRTSAQFSQTIRGVETYRNPSTGETIELSNQYGHAWVNNRGEYLLSDQAGFDPNVAFKESWQPLQHVQP